VACHRKRPAPTNASMTVRAMKRIAQEVVKDPGDRNLDICAQLIDGFFASDDHKDGRKAFLEKCKPRFRGR